MRNWSKRLLVGSLFLGAFGGSARSAPVRIMPARFSSVRAATTFRAIEESAPTVPKPNLVAAASMFEERFPVTRLEEESIPKIEGVNQSNGMYEPQELNEPTRLDEALPGTSGPFAPPQISFVPLPAQIAGSLRSRFICETALAPAPEQLLKDGIIALRAGSAAKAVKKFGESVRLSEEAGDPPSNEVKLSLRNLEKSKDFAGTARILEAQLGYRSYEDQVFANTIQLEAKGHRVRSVLSISAAGSFSDQRTDRPDLVYGDPSIPIANIDFETEPHENLARLAQSNRYALMEIMVPDGFGFVVRPDRLEMRDEGGFKTSYSRVYDGIRGNTSQGRPLRVVVVRSCDTNGDGRISKEEQARCGIR
jgi:hypothetical protein